MYCVEEETNKKKTVSESESESYKLGTKKTEEGKSTQHRNSKKRHTHTDSSPTTTRQPLNSDATLLRRRWIVWSNRMLCFICKDPHMITYTNR